MNRPAIIIVCLTLALILAIGLVFPKKNDLGSLTAKINEKKAELQSKEEYFAELEKTSEALKKYPAQLSKISSSLPKSPQLPSLFEFLQENSSQTGLVLKNINPVFHKPSEEVEGVEESSLSLAVSGTYSAFRDFLSVLENSSRLIEIENISFSTQESFSDFNLRVKAYSY